MKVLLVSILCFISIVSKSQHINWTADEEIYYNKTKKLCKFLQSLKYDTSKRDYIFKNYVFFNNPKNDPSKLDNFDYYFYKFYHFIDSVGINNLDAKPVRFFKTDSSFYKPFETDLKWADSLSLAYFDKRKPKKALGALLYENNFHKLVSWIILNMDGYLFLTPNLY